MKSSKEIIRNVLLDLLVVIAVFIIDIFDLPSRIIPENFRTAYIFTIDYLGANETYTAIISVALLAIIILCIILDAKRIKEIFVDKSINSADKLIANSWLISSLTLCLYGIIKCYAFVKINTLVFVEIVATVYLVIRLACTRLIRSKNKALQHNLHRRPI